MAMRHILILIALASCVTSSGSSTPEPSCRDRCDTYRIENEGGWSGLVKLAGEDRSKYQRCMELCRQG